MIIPSPVLDELTAAMPQIRCQMYFKSSLTALSHAMEDQVLAGDDQPIVIASFQRERFYRQEAHRYVRIAERTDQVYVLAAPEADFTDNSEYYETVAFEPGDGLCAEWHLIVLGKNYASCLLCKEKMGGPTPTLHVDQSRRFEGLWTFDREIVFKSAEIMMQRIMRYRPELTEKIIQGMARFPHADVINTINRVDPEPFAERLVTYLQAGQYKLSKAYRSISLKERRERLVNVITSAVRQSLDPEAVLQVAAQEIGQTLKADRCLIYRCKDSDKQVTLAHEFLDQRHGQKAPRKTTAKSTAKRAKASSAPPALESLVGKRWDLYHNPVFQTAAQTLEPVYLEDTQTAEPFNQNTACQSLIGTYQIGAWLMVPMVHQDHLVGMLELHFCTPQPDFVTNHDLELVEAVASQVGIALIQAEAYANLEDLNQQLEALDRTRSNLIAITGHELRTPLTTIQVCIESLATDPDMSLDLRQVMLNSAMTDAERMRKLIQDFLTLSRLEGGRIEWRFEPMPLWECVELALSSIRSRYKEDLPQIKVDLPEDLPFVHADGEWLVESISRLLDNACKFTPSAGEIRIQAKADRDTNMMEVIVIDTGRGIEPHLLETIFERFYQEEGALRRSTGGTGLGLAICRQIITNWGGQIWGKSAGKDQGSEFHFTIPMIVERPETPKTTASKKKPKSGNPSRKRK
ncbi:GAF domain-containing protein [filamentous cyanobacterium LEGE 11480]|uniref:histidine kinase n=1 Tax=Romeriopsis navalis LEGE 11480 TaxID=2777977 RepID=A0A928Z6U2_9CYAN|nr:DICT sensory domain-containing protein [Romeriopsis navalis]MBE9033347.1 GAF domain-containing protein [Romeriopsis navalis LEGE 11480]